MQNKDICPILCSIVSYVNTKWWEMRYTPMCLAEVTNFCAALILNKLSWHGILPCLQKLQKPCVIAAPNVLAISNEFVISTLNTKLLQEVIPHTRQTHCRHGMMSYENLVISCLTFWSLFDVIFISFCPKTRHGPKLVKKYTVCILVWSQIGFSIIYYIIKCYKMFVIFTYNDTGQYCIPPTPTTLGSMNNSYTLSCELLLWVSLAIVISCHVVYHYGLCGQ